MLKSGESCSLSIVGDGSSGKSTIINYFKTEGFLPVYKQTVGIEFYEKQLKLRGDVFLSLRLWDIGGQSIHSKNLDTYLSNSQVVFIVYDLTNIDSFNNLTGKFLIEFNRRHLSFSSN
jgi:small GTP-binding protein